MTALNRRGLLQVAGGGLVLALAGCSDRNEQATDTDRNAADIVDTTTITFATRASRPDWFSEAGADLGEVVVINSRERAEAVLWPNEGVPEQRRADILEFLEETDFQTQVVVFVESVGKNLCYNEIAIEDVVLDGDAVSATATVRDTSEGDGACGSALIYPSVLVRVSFAEEPVTEAAIDIVDSWDNEATITASAADPLGPNPDELSGYVRPEGDPAHVPETLDCDREGMTRVESWIDDDAISWGTLTDKDGRPTWALRVDDTEFEVGETTTISLTNVAEETLATGNRNKYSMEQYTAAGWQDVRLRTDDLPLEYTDEAIYHAPGEGFTWEFELTSEALFADHTHTDRTTVCPDLSPGRYRFVCYEPAIAVAFDIVE